MKEEVDICCKHLYDTYINLKIHQSFQSFQIQSEVKIRLYRRIPFRFLPTFDTQNEAKQFLP